MSRSYHTTRRDLREEEARSYRDTEKRAESIERLKEELEKKRRTKRHVRYERDGSFPEACVTPIESIAFEVRDRMEYLHYPASAEDIRALLQAMPSGIVDGLSKIVFCLGAERQSRPEYPWVADTEPDPFLNRQGYEVLPGVYMGRCVGVYHVAKAEIRLHGYVYRPDLAERRMWELYLRLHMLMTFVHEVAHHYDFAFRIGRGRWRGDNRENVEIYAETIQHKWLTDYIIPFLRKRYPEECDGLRSWIKRHAGIEVPFDVIAGDPRATAKNGLIRACSIWDTGEAFRDFVQKTHVCGDVKEARLDLANDLHMAGAYDLALEIVELILTSDQRHVEAISLKADIYVHLDRYEEAIAIARHALSIDPSYVDAYEDLCDAYEGLEDWRKVVELSDTIINEVRDKDRFQYRSAMGMKARALAKMGRMREAEEVLCDMEEGDARMRRFAERMRKRIAESAGE